MSRSLRYGQRLASLAERIQRVAAVTDAASTDEGDTDDEHQGSSMEHLRSVQPAEVSRMTAVLHDRWTNLNRGASAATQFLASCLLRRQEALLKAVEMHLGQLEWEK